MANASSAAPTHDAVKLVYILYFVGFFIPLAALAGVVVAYVNIKDAGLVAQSHYTFQIRSFWIGLGAAVIGGLLTLILIGWLVLLVWTVWALARFITGLLKASDGKPVDQPEGWGFMA